MKRAAERVEASSGASEVAREVGVGWSADSAMGNSGSSQIQHLDRPPVQAHPLLRQVRNKIRMDADWPRRRADRRSASNLLALAGAQIDNGAVEDLVRRARCRILCVGRSDCRE